MNPAATAAIQWADLVPLLGVIAIAAGALWKAWSMIQAAKDESAKAIQIVRDEVAQLRLQSAREFVAHSNLKATEDRLVAAIDRLADRFDRALEQRDA